MKYILLLLLSLTSLSLCVAQKKAKNDSTWLISDKGCKVYNHIPNLFKEVKWSGECKNGYAEGSGILMFYKKGKEVQRAEVNLIRGIKNGYCMVENFTYQQINKGNYKNGKLDGEGELIKVNKFGKESYKYVGGFKEGVYHGQGQEYLYYDDEEGDLYKWVSGIYKDWNIVEEGRIETKYFFNDNSYELYIGESKYYKKSGQGEYWLYNEDDVIMSHYKGNFNNDKKSGYGEEWIGKNYYRGIWEDDKKEKQGMLYYNDLLIYDGEWVNNKPEGKGKKYHIDGSIFIGDFKKGLMDGFGIFKWSNGNVYFGGVQYGKFNGSGFIEKNGEILYSGFWYNGSLKQKQDAQAIKKKIYKLHKDEITKFKSIQE